MRPLHHAQRPTSVRERRLVSVGIWLLACILLLPDMLQAQAAAPTTARELSNTFRNAARQALPAVVFITVHWISVQRVPVQYPF